MPAEVTISPRKVQLTTRSGVEISRLIPHQQLRAIGAWVFLDYYGPTNQREAMSVGAHPQVGLQTVSWLFSGEIEHRDSLQSSQLVNPGELNLMTAGAGIAHSELSLDSTTELHGVQLWTVLPESVRSMAPRFEHYSQLPHFRRGAMEIKLFTGDLLGHSSPATRYSELLGAEISFDEGSQTTFDCQPDFEYGFLLIGGDLIVNGNAIAEGQLHYLPPATALCEISSSSGARVILLGGAPFREKIIMWWNFIGRTHEEIVAMRNDWNSRTPTIPVFADQINYRIPAPELPALQLTPRSLQR